MTPSHGNYLRLLRLLEQITTHSGTQSTVSFYRREVRNGSHRPTPRCLQGCAPSEGSRGEPMSLLLPAVQTTCVPPPVSEGPALLTTLRPSCVCPFHSSEPVMTLGLPGKCRMTSTCSGLRTSNLLPTCYGDPPAPRKPTESQLPGFTRVFRRPQLYGSRQLWRNIKLGLDPRLHRAQNWGAHESRTELPKNKVSRSAQRHSIPTWACREQVDGAQ